MAAIKSGGASTRARPALVWLIFAICCLLALVPWITYALVILGLDMAPGARQYLARLGTRYYAFSALDTVLMLAAGIALVRLSRQALSLFVAGLLAYFLGMWLFQSTETQAGFGSYQNGQELAKVVFQLAAIAYCIRLMRHGLLRS